jgi:uncharacterized protein YndB with AHSA1/START domain
LYLKEGILVTGNNEIQAVAARVGEKELVMERSFDAPRSLVFAAFTKPEHLARWWAPGGYTIPVCNIDLRPGGVWHYCMRSAEGAEHWARSVYREISPPEKLIYTSTFADKDGNVTDDIPEQLVTVIFEEQDGRTLLTTRYQFASEEALQETLTMGLKQGYTETLNSLARLLDTISG